MRNRDESVQLCNTGFVLQVAMNSVPFPPSTPFRIETCCKDQAAASSSAVAAAAAAEVVKL